MQLELPLPKSPSGMVYRHCPEEGCRPRLFQLGDFPADVGAIDRPASARRPANTNGTTCPYCGRDADDAEFTHPADIQSLEDYVAWAATEDISDILEGVGRDFNRRTRHSGGGLKVKRRYRPKPHAYREDLLRDLTCNLCGRRYRVYAIALFCPECGCRNLQVHFRREIDLVESQIRLAQASSREGHAELAYRLLGNGHEDVLTAFETYLKTVYRFVVRQRTPERWEELCTKRSLGNTFQNVERTRKRFESLDIHPFAALGEDAVATLRRNIEKRHVVGHNLSMVDEHYADAAQGKTPGETVQILTSEVAEFADVCRRVIERLETTVPELAPGS